MDWQRSARKPVIAAMGALLAFVSVSAGATAHLGDSDHIHYPAKHSTPISSVWCVRFSEDPGVWRPDGETSVDASLLGDGKIIFLDCSDVLAGESTLESFQNGEHSRTTFGEPAIGTQDTPAQAADTPVADTPVADTPVAETKPMSVAAWTKHQKKWLQKGDKLAAKLTRVRTASQARRSLGDFQRFLRAETIWLRKHSDRFEPDSCVAQDKSDWQKRVKLAQKSLNKAVMALSHGNLAGVSSNIRQFTRAWTKVEQIYRIGRCDF